MPESRPFQRGTILSDLVAGVAVFLVALPLCLGIAQSSGHAPAIAGIVCGIVGGILVGALSGSQVSISGPSAGLTAIVTFQIASLRGFDAFLPVVVIAGGMQILMGLAQVGGLSAFVPTSVTRGLLAAIGVILILKQIPHLLGHDTDPEGDMSFMQPDRENTLSEFGEMLVDMHPGATVVGLLCLAVAVAWEVVPRLRAVRIPSPLVIVLLGMTCQMMFQNLSPAWRIESIHLVQVPVSDSLTGTFKLLHSPDWRQLSQPQVWQAALILALAASLETLVSLEAVDKLDRRRRKSPANRELVAQGCGNVVSGLLGGLPMTTVIINSSINNNAGSRTKVAAIVHGLLLLASFLLIPQYLNHIPQSCLAAILLMTGWKLARPLMERSLWTESRDQLLPFVVTIIAILFTNLLTGVVIGLAVSLGFILNSNLRRPLRVVQERHVAGDVTRIQLAEQVSFLHRAALEKLLFRIPRGGHVLLDAGQTDYIDPDVLQLIREFRDKTAQAHGVQVSMTGFRERYQLKDEIQFVDYSSREVQEQMTPSLVLQLLLEGNERFREGRRLTRDLGRQITSTADSQHPIAVILSCIDSRAPAELVFDAGLGDLLNVRVAGNVTSPKVLGSIEYSCAVAGARLVLVMGHTRCGAVSAAVSEACSKTSVSEATGCSNLAPILSDIHRAIEAHQCELQDHADPEEKQRMIDRVARSNVIWSATQVLEQSPILQSLVDSGRLGVVGVVYDVVTGSLEMVPEARFGPLPELARPEMRTA
jgi:carbonic anhydrase/SulP family sulfate permease